jgi:hypothetical protein
MDALWFYYGSTTSNALSRIPKTYKHGDSFVYARCKLPVISLPQQCNPLELVRVYSRTDCLMSRTDILQRLSRDVRCAFHGRSLPCLSVVLRMPRDTQIMRRHCDPLHAHLIVGTNQSPKTFLRVKQIPSSSVSIHGKEVYCLLLVRGLQNA